VITGDGATFCGGVDFKAVPGYTAGEKVEMIGHINAAITLLYGLPTATVAAVNGHAIGAGLVLMLACDARLVAGVHVKLGLTEVTAGIPYPACPLEVVKAEIEPGRRRHLVLSGDLLSPRDALVGGLVDELVALPDLLERAVELARRRAAAPAYEAVKRQLRADTVARMAELVASGRDPVLESWR
jgi:enoyl-CoA hydratase